MNDWATQTIHRTRPSTHSKPSNRLRLTSAPAVFLLTALAALAWLTGGLAAGDQTGVAGTSRRPVGTTTAVDSTSPLQLVVMDPLSKVLACDCAGDYAQRDYDALAQFLRHRLGRPVKVHYTESLLLPRSRTLKRVDLVVGKWSEVFADASKRGWTLVPLAMLTDQNGEVSQPGLFVVRRDDPAQSLADLKGRQVLFGSPDAQEKHAAALAALEAFDVHLDPADVATTETCTTAALAVAEGDVDAAVVSSYAMPLLKGCGTVDKDALRVVGRTDPVPFVVAAVRAELPEQTRQALRQALADVGKNEPLCRALQTRDGFVLLRPAVWSAPLADRGSTSTVGWPDWRGPHRNGFSQDVPRRLPSRLRLLWSRVLTGPGMSGLSVAEGCVVVADKSLDDSQDIFHCLDADTGRELWRLSYPAAGEMDFTNSPRATPVIWKGRVFLLGAFGHLHCVELHTGRVLWKRHLPTDFHAEVPSWGYSSTPLLVDGKLVVNPGAADASLVALDAATGRLLWKTPGEPAAYASFVLAAPNGRRQIVGYDAVSLGGWDPQTGRRLWKVVPELDGDYNVPTPLVLGNRLLVATENNGTRLYEFDGQGRLRPQPVARSEELVPHTSTPVVCNGLVLGSDGRLVALDLKHNLRLAWSTDEDPFADYLSFVTDGRRVLVTCQSGRLCLLQPTASGPGRLACVDLFPDVAVTDRDVWSHPALVGNRFYVRNSLAVYCFLLE